MSSLNVSYGLLGHQISGLQSCTVPGAAAAAELVFFHLFGMEKSNNDPNSFCF